MKNLKLTDNIFAKVAGGCFALVGLITLINFFRYGFYFVTLLNAVAYFALAALALVNEPIAGYVGFGIRTLLCLRTLFSYFGSSISIGWFVGIILYALVPLFVFGIGLYGFFYNGVNKKLFYMGGGAIYIASYIIGEVFDLLYYTIISGYGFYFSFISLLTYLAISIGLFAYGLSLND